MTNLESQAGKIINNVEILDLRTATPAAVARISRINNVVLLLYSNETAGLVTQLAIHNLAGMVEAPINAQVSNGQTVLTQSALVNLSEPLNLIVNGQLRLEADVEPADIATAVGSLIVNGQIICPKHLVGAVKQKILYLDGQVATANDGGQMGNVVLSSDYLHALADATELKIVGTLTVTTVLPNDLLEQKIKSIQLLGKLICCEENVPTLRARLVTGGVAPQITVIPASNLYVDKPLVLDANQIQTLPGKKLYCAWLRITEDVDPSLFDAALENLVVTDTLIAPTQLRTSLASKCDLLKPRVIFYPGELWYIENDATLLAARFDFLTDKATLLVTGTLTLAEDVEPQVLASRLDRVHNLGSIHGKAAQLAALQSRLGVDEGEFVDTTTPVSAGENVIDNVIYLKL